MQKRLRAFPWLSSLRAMMGLLVMGLLVGHAPAQAQNVLLLRTTEALADTAFTNMKKEFEGAGATVTEHEGLDIANSVTDATFVTAGGGKYDIVIMTSAYAVVDSSNWNPINTAIRDRKANAFMMFNDGCCHTENVSAMADSIAATGAFTPALGVSSPSGALPSELNANSPFSTSFSSLNTLVGGDVAYFDNVPADNALYLAPGSAQPALGTTVNNVYALLVPQSHSYGGNGACVFATVDLTPFDEVYGGIYTNQNAGKIAPVFLKAIAAGGSCGIPTAISKAFSQATIKPGGETTLTITIENTATTSVGGLSVTDNLPAPLQVSRAGATSCTGGTLAAAPGSSSVSLSGAEIPVGGCSITVHVTWPNAQAAQCAAPGASVTNTITPGVDFTTAQGQMNTPATASLNCLADVVVPPQPGNANPVPTLSQWGLMALSLLLGLVGWRSRHNFMSNRR